MSRRKQNARFLLSPTIHRGEYLARAIRKQNTRRASPDKRICARSLFACARVRMFSSGQLKYLAYFCWELIRAVIPASGCALKILSTNSPPTTHPFPSSLSLMTLKGAHHIRTCLQFPRVSVSWGRRLYDNIRGALRKK